MALTAGFELFDHTADLGVRVRAPTLAGLVPPATEGLYAAIGDVQVAGAPAAWTRALAGEEPALLLRDYLAEVLHLFAAAGRRLIDVQVDEFSPRRLAVRGRAQPVDAARSALQREVKAVTYHELTVRLVAGGYEATFIVDI